MCTLPIHAFTIGTLLYMTSKLGGGGGGILCKGVYVEMCRWHGLQILTFSSHFWDLGVLMVHKFAHFTDNRIWIGTCTDLGCSWKSLAAHPYPIPGWIPPPPPTPPTPGIKICIIHRLNLNCVCEFRSNCVLYSYMQRGRGGMGKGERELWADSNIRYMNTLQVRMSCDSRVVVQEVVDNVPECAGVVRREEVSLDLVDGLLELHVTLVVLMGVVPSRWRLKKKIITET